MEKNTILDSLFVHILKLEIKSFIFRIARLGLDSFNWVYNEFNLIGGLITYNKNQTNNHKQLAIQIFKIEIR